MISVTHELLDKEIKTFKQMGFQKSFQIKSSNLYFLELDIWLNQIAQIIKYPISFYSILMGYIIEFRIYLILSEISRFGLWSAINQFWFPNTRKNRGCWLKTTEFSTVKISNIPKRPRRLIELHQCTLQFLIIRAGLFCRWKRRDILFVVIIF